MTTERRDKASDEAVTPALDEAVAQVRYRIDQSRTWEGMKYGPPNRKVFVETAHLEVLIAAASRPSPAERDRESPWAGKCGDCKHHWNGTDCRRHAPVFGGPFGETRWPRTTAHDTCGDYEPRASGASDA